MKLTIEVERIDDELPHEVLSTTTQELTVEDLNVQHVRLHLGYHTYLVDRHHLLRMLAICCGWWRCSDED